MSILFLGLLVTIGFFIYVAIAVVVHELMLWYLEWYAAATALDDLAILLPILWPVGIPILVGWIVTDNFIVCVSRYICRILYNRGDANYPGK